MDYLWHTAKFCENLRTSAKVLDTRNWLEEVCGELLKRKFTSNGYPKYYKFFICEEEVVSDNTLYLRWLSYSCFFVSIITRVMKRMRPFGWLLHKVMCHTSQRVDLLDNIQLLGLIPRLPLFEGGTVPFHPSHNNHLGFCEGIVDLEKRGSKRPEGSVCVV